MRLSAGVDVAVWVRNTCIHRGAARKYPQKRRFRSDDVQSRAGVIIGAEKVDVWLDHIRLYEGEFVADIDGAEPQAVEPSDKLTTTWATLKAL